MVARAVEAWVGVLAGVCRLAIPLVRCNVPSELDVRIRTSGNDTRRSARVLHYLVRYQTRETFLPERRQMYVYSLFPMSSVCPHATAMTLIG